MNASRTDSRSTPAAGVASGDDHASSGTGSSHVADSIGGGSGGRRAGGPEVHRASAALALGEHVQAHVGGDAVQPRAQRRAALEPVAWLPGAQQRLLDGVLGLERRAEHPVAVGRAARDGSALEAGGRVILDRGWSAGPVIGSILAPDRPTATAVSPRAASPRPRVAKRQHAAASRAAGGRPAERSSACPRRRRPRAGPARSRRSRPPISAASAGCSTPGASASRRRSNRTGSRSPRPRRAGAGASWSPSHRPVTGLIRHARRDVLVAAEQVGRVVHAP